MRRQFKSFVADTRGNIAILSALLLIVVMGGAALGVDVGTAFADRRKAQSTTDIAALVAASNLTNASSAVAAAISQNHFNPTAPAGIQLGIYTANAAIPPSQRFQPTNSVSAANAVQVTLQTTTPLYFGRVLIGRDTFDIKTTATATATAFAAFEIGSTLVSLNGGLINQILGQMLGTSLSLSAMDYQSLLNANIDMFTFMNAIATRLGVTGVTYTSLLSGHAQVGTVLNAMIDSEKAGSASSATIFALSEIASALNGATANIPLGALVDPGTYGSMTVGQTPSTSVSMNLYGLLAAAAALANGKNQIAASLNVGLPGITSVSLMLAVGQPPVGTSWVTVGPTGASVYTAQTRVLLTAQIQGSGGIASINLPIYVSLATGSATLNSVQCGYPDISTSSVTLGVTPGVIDSWIGNVTPSDFTNMSSPPQPGPATLVSAGGITVTGLAHVAMNNMSATPVNFSYGQIQSQTPQTVSTTNYTSLVSQLLGSLNLGVSVAGLSLGLPAGVTQTVSSVIAAQATPLNQLLADILATAGVSIGQATVWVTGIRCDGAVLVN